MSRVIKSYRANVTSPVTIEQGPVVGWPRFEPELERELEIADDSVELEMAPDTIESTQRTAEEILRETEAMVKELLANAKAKAEEILSDAGVQAELEIAAAERAKEQIHAQAHQTGYQAGYSAGKQAIEAELHHLRLEAEQQLAMAVEQKQQIIDEAENEIIQLALAIAEKVIRNEVAANSQVVKSAVQAAMGKVTDREEVVVKVNPDDLDEVMGIQDRLYAQAQGVNRFKIVSDPLISQGGCVIETPCGTVDGRIERQLSEIRDALLEVS